MNLNRSQWEKLMGRWSAAPACPERSLLIAVIAQAVVDECDRAKANDVLPNFRKGFFLDGMKKYCTWLQMDGEFLIDQFEHARDFKEAA
jgi:hypothetical protein